MPLLALVLAINSIGAGMSMDLTGSEWRPSYIHSHAVPAEERIYVAFKPDGQVVGSGGCNRFFGGYTVDGNAIRIGPIASTKKGCPGKYKLETSFLAALQTAKTFDWDGSKLVLFGESGQALAQLIQADGT